MSPRTLTRWCRQELGESPAALVRRLRVEEAQRLLEQTSLWKPKARGRFVLLRSPHATVDTNTTSPIPPGYRRPVAARREASPLACFQSLGGIDY
jgi:AraC-like DNA-binding protein